MMWAAYAPPVTASTPGPGPLSTTAVLQLTVLVFISTVGTFANALVFAVFYRRPSLRTISNRFVLSMILANVTSAVVSIPGHIYHVIQDQETRPTGPVSAPGPLTRAEAMKMIYGHWWSFQVQGLDGLTVLVTLASVLSILLISLDRYYAVNSPLHYSIIITRQKSMVMIFLVWTIAGVLSAPVWTGSVILEHQQQSYHQHDSSWEQNSTVTAMDAKGDATSGGNKWREEQQQVINICYSVLVFLFGFVWPLTALCWLYLRMYEAALKNAARTRRQSLSSNATDNVQIAPDALPSLLPPTIPPQHASCNFAHQSPASSASNISETSGTQQPVREAEP